MTLADTLKAGQGAFFAKPPDYQKAKDCFERVTFSAPKWVEGHHWLAAAWESLADPDQATKAYRQAIQCDPKDSRPKIALGRLLTNMGRLKEGIIELQKGIELKPHYGEADTRLFLAEAFEKAKNLSKAKEQLEIVARMKPSYPSYDKPMREAQKKLQEHAEK